MKKNAFTMIELVFVIVVLGILASIAIPKLAATRTDAVLATGKADVASIRSSLVSERQTWLIRGTSSYISVGKQEDTIGTTKRKHMDKDGLFGGLLMYGKESEPNKDGKWSLKTADTYDGNYTFRVQGTDIAFKYTKSDGKFYCKGLNTADKAKKFCKSLTR